MGDNQYTVKVSFCGGQEEGAVCMHILLLVIRHHKICAADKAVFTVRNQKQDISSPIDKRVIRRFAATCPSTSFSSLNARHFVALKMETEIPMKVKPLPVAAGQCFPRKCCFALT
jgi:hypothetical protein